MENFFKTSHLYAFWGGYSSPQVHLFDLIAHQAGTYPKVVVAVSQQGMSLCLSYFVEKIDWLNFANFDQRQFDRQDYLWEQNCLECFFEFNHQSAYLEMNNSPNGAYNFYHFDAYRTPDSMPPKQDSQAKLSYVATKDSCTDWHIRHLNVVLDDYFMEFSHQGQTPCTITKINSTVILYQNGEPIYYAIKHASPPDFHNKAFWHSL